jgi:hypothetical protein
MEARLTYTEVVPRRRLAYDHLAMHDEVWTERAVMGWESELGKLAKLAIRCR